jgi:hypothetical protein
VSPSASLGMDRLPAAEADDLASGWLQAPSTSPSRSCSWATAAVADVRPALLEDALGRGCVGLEVSADVLAVHDGLGPLAPVLRVLGDSAFAFMNMLVARDLNKCEVGQCKYVFVTAPDAGSSTTRSCCGLEENRCWLPLADSDVLLWAQGVAHGPGSTRLRLASKRWIS